MESRKIASSSSLVHAMFDKATSDNDPRDAKGNGFLDSNDLLLHPTRNAFQDSIEIPYRNRGNHFLRVHILENARNIRDANEHITIDGFAHACCRPVTISIENGAIIADSKRANDWNYA